MDSSLKQENGSATTSPLMSPSHLQKKARFSVNNIDMYSDSTKTDSDKVDTESEKSCHESHETRDRARTNSQSMNQQTYNTLYLKSLRNYLTRDALPDERHYRNQLSIRRKFLRPTMDELHDEQEKLELFKKDVEEAQSPEDENKAKGKVVKFGWLDGVFMRCLLNIWGVMLFLRLTWVVGQAGLLQGLLVIILCNTVTFITAISMSAVSTNGQIKAGGIYYMISRSLGPEFGGAIGIMFTIANSIAVSMYVIGFCDSLFDMLAEYIEGFNGIVATSDNRLNDVRLIGCCTLVAILALAIVGMEWVTRVQMLLLLLLVGSQFDFIIGSFLPAEEEKKYGFVGYSSDVVSRNFHSNYHPNEDGKEAPSFFSVFGVFFPAVTGIVAGANLSGDLKDPATAIPKGTLLAILVTFISYFGYAAMIGSCYLSEASGIEEEYIAAITLNSSILHFDNCDPELRNGTRCKFGSSNDFQTMSKVSLSGYLIYAGCFAATLSSAIASLVGAPRVLQALAKDNLYPLIGVFGVGYGANNDPFRGYILVFFVAVGCILIGDLEAVATLLSNFFVAAYTLINFSVFHASITKSPGWRPSFKYYSQWVSLLGTFLCVAVMFLMDWVTALITFGIVGVLYFYINYRKPDANWGSSAQAVQFVTSLKNVQALNDVPDHVKNYRPKILVFTGLPAHRQPLVEFANLITKKISLLICADVDTNIKPKDLETKRTSAFAWLKYHNIKAFYSLIPNVSFEQGAISCIDLCGLGKLTHNMLLLGYKSNWTEDLNGLDEYMNVLHHGFDVYLSMGILRVKGGCDFSKPSETTRTVTEQGDANENDEFEDEDQTGKDSNESDQKSSKNSETDSNDESNAKMDNELSLDIKTFKKTTKLDGFIDVWWLYDDGGLTLLIPYILTTRSQFRHCKLRVFALANKKDELDRETRNMASLLSKFRIDYHDVTVIPDVTKKARNETKAEFYEITKKVGVDETEMSIHKEKNNRHMRFAETLRENSKMSDLIVMTLPMPRKGSTSNALYMSWLEIMTRDLPPCLLVRGNQTSVLTFYS